MTVSDAAHRPREALCQHLLASIIERWLTARGVTSVTSRSLPTGPRKTPCNCRRRGRAGTRGHLANASRRWPQSAALGRATRIGCSACATRRTAV